MGSRGKWKGAFESRWQDPIEMTMTSRYKRSIVVTMWSFLHDVVDLLVWISFLLSFALILIPRRILLTSVFICAVIISADSLI